MTPEEIRTSLSTIRQANTMSAEAKELALWIESTGAFYSQVESLIRNLKRKIDKGVYQPDLAVKLWLNFVQGCLRHPEFKITYGDWTPSRQDVVQAATYLSEAYYDDIITGEYDHLNKTASDNVDLETTLITALHTAGYDDERVRYAIGEQWVAKVVSNVVEEIVSRPQLFQSLVDGIIDRVKARL